MNIRLYIFVFLVFGRIFVSNSQNIQYDIELKNIDSLFFAVVTMTIPDNVDIPTDSILIQWPLISYTQKHSSFTQSLIKSGETEFYLRRARERAFINNCEIVIDGQNFKFRPNELENNFLVLPQPKNRVISFSYDFVLPEWHFSMGIYKDKIISLAYFYPKLVDIDGQWKKQSYKKESFCTYYKQDVTLHVPHLDSFFIVANGRVDSSSEKSTIYANDVSQLFVSYVNHKAKISQEVLFSGAQKVNYTITHDSLTPLSKELALDSLQSIFNRLTSILGPYPYEHLVINNIGKGQNSDYDSGVFFISDNKYNFYFQLINTWLKGQFKKDCRTDNWMIRGLSIFYFNQLNLDKPIQSQYKQNFKSNYEAQLYNVSLNSKKIGNKQCVLKNYYLSVSFFEYIEEILGQKALNLALNNLIKTQTELNVNHLIQELKKHTSESLDFINVFVNNETPISFNIKKVDLGAKGTEVVVESDKNIFLPIPMTVGLRNNEQKTIIIPPFEGEKTISLPEINFSDVLYIVLDKNQTLPDVKRKDNMWIFDKEIDQIEFYKQNPKYNNRFYRVFPTITYNDNNRFMAGIYYSNNSDRNYKKTGYMLHPSYSLRKNKIQGEASIYHDIYTQNPIIDRIRLSTEVRSYFFNYFEDQDYAQQYVRIDPEIHLRFKKALRRGADSGISLKTYFIREDNSFGEGGMLPIERSENFTIFRAKYYQTHPGILTSSHHEVSLEQQSYNEESYLKLTASWMQNWMYKDKKYMSLRLFGSGFLVNTQRQSSSYQSELVRGSIALIHQGFNDYTYDEYFFGRQNQNQTQRHQVSMYNGGGFKTAVGSAHSIGMSNNFALAANWSMDLPFSPKILPIQLYYDIGTYSTYSGEKFVNNVMYNGGVSLGLLGIFYIHVPFVYSEDLGNIHKEVHKNLFNRISFSFNLDRLSTSNLLFKNFRKW